MATTTNNTNPFINTWTPTQMVVVVRRDPEMADMDNPRGEVYGTLWFPCYEYANGRRFLDRGVETIDQCLDQCSFLNCNDIIPNQMMETEPAYLSEAYFQNQ